MPDIKGIGSEGVIILTLYLLVREVIIPIFKFLIKKVQIKNGKIQTVRNNPSSNPGGFLCHIHGEKLLKIELENERICRELKQVQSELRDLRLKLTNG